MTQPTAPNADAVGCVSISGAVAEFAAAAAVFAAKIAMCTRCCGQRVWCDCPARCICRPGDELHAPVQPADCPRHGSVALDADLPEILIEWRPAAGGGSYLAATRAPGDRRPTPFDPH